MDIRNYPGPSRGDLFPDTFARGQNRSVPVEMVYFKKIEWFLGLDGLRPCLNYKQFPRLPILCPFYIHGKFPAGLFRVMMLYCDCLAGKLGNLLIGETETSLLSRRHFNIPGLKLGGAAAIDHLDLLFTQLLPYDRIEPLIQSRLEDVEFIRIDGSLRIAGQDINGPDIDVIELRKRVGMVFQKSNPFPKSIYDNIAYGPRVNGIRDRAALDEIVEQSLRRAAIWDETKDRLRDSALGLSGGQQQRLCIARSLAVNPDILLMDEPASALDPISTAKIEELIFELKDRYTIVIVTHNMQQAARVSDHTAFFYLGELVEFNSTRDLFTKPAKKQTEEYVTGRFG